MLKTEDAVTLESVEDDDLEASAEILVAKVDVLAEVGVTVEIAFSKTLKCITILS